MSGRDEDLEAASWAQAAIGHNDPRYHETLAETARDMTTIKSGVAAVRVVETRRGSHIEIEPANPKLRTQVMETAQALGRQSEAPVFRVAPDQEGPSYSQPPRHTHYKDDRRR